MAVAFTAEALTIASRSFILPTMTIWEEEFGWERAHLSAARAVMMVLQGVMSPVSGHLVDSLGPRPGVMVGIVLLTAGLVLQASMTDSLVMLFLCFGLWQGVALGLMNMHVFTTTATIFMPPRLHNTAMAIADVGSTAGQALLVPLFAVLSESSWRVAYLCAAGCVFLLMPLCWVMLDPVRLPDAKGEGRDGGGTGTVDGAEDAVDVKKDGHGARDKVTRGFVGNLMLLHCSGPFNALLFAFFVCGVTTTGLIETHFVAFAEGHGHSKIEGSLMFSVLNGE